jgi:hypothetical protein
MALRDERAGEGKLARKNCRQRRAFWSAPAERSGDSALDSAIPETQGCLGRVFQSKAVSRFALPPHSKRLCDAIGSEVSRCWLVLFRVFRGSIGW